MSTILVAGCNARYWPTFQGCVQALQAHANVPYQLFAVGFGVDGYTTISHDQNYGAPPETECIQHGSFLQALPAAPSDVIMYLDGDVGMQRPLCDGELWWLANFPDNAVCATWNQIGETLAQCATYIGPQRGPDELIATWGEIIQAAPSLNAGMVVARRSTWERAYDFYLKHWELATACFRHQARQQWLMCWTWAALGLDIQVMPWAFHAHGHFGLKPGMAYGPDGIYVDGKMAAFRHHV